MIEDVIEFNNATGLVEHHLSDKHGVHIIMSEVDELRVALEDGDDVETADALIDIVFATLSCADRWGYPLQELWDEVVRSNMSKVGAPIVDGKLQKGLNFSAPDIASILS